MGRLTKPLERFIEGDNVLVALALVGHWSDVGNGNAIARIDRSRA
ncbi:hypothetical protein XHC_2784 [Xanthomonas hortorum pv. carotae str. M081]|nr:hypothetical protein XHC_2784 [Xanthomonas hortorum pv. carotae str. M081]